MLNLYWKSKTESRNLVAKPFNTEEEFVHVLSTLPIVKDEVKQSAMAEF